MVVGVLGAIVRDMVSFLLGMMVWEEETMSRYREMSSNICTNDVELDEVIYFNLTLGFT